MPRRVITNKDVALVRELRAKGFTVPAMAQVMRCSTSSVDRIISMEGLNKLKSGRPPGKPWTAADDTIIRKMVADGRSPGDVARKLGRQVVTTRKRASDIGCPFPVFGGISAPVRLSENDARAEAERVWPKMRYEDNEDAARRNAECFSPSRKFIPSLSHRGALGESMT